MKRLLMLLILTCFLSQSAWAGPVTGEVPELIVLDGKLGGRVDGTSWSSEEMKGKVHVLFYVDPDEKDLNNDASEALKKEKFPRDRYQSVGIINMAATWLPNFVISSLLEEKQKKYPDTIYVRDYKKVIVKKWGISDDNSDILAFDKKGKLIFWKDGKLDADDITKLIKAIRDHLDK